MKQISTFFASMVCAIVSTPWGAAATILTSPAELTPPTVFIGFEALPKGGVVPFGEPILSDQWRSRGVLIVDSSPENGAAASNRTNGVPPHTGLRGISDSDRSTAGGFLEFLFVVPGTDNAGTVAEAGLWVQNGDDPSTVSFFDASDELLQSITTSESDFFAGIRAPEGIARIRITDPDFYLVDDLQFAPVPEPASATLLTFAALTGGSLAARPRRRWSGYRRSCR
jgi:hypothetical protein